MCTTRLVRMIDCRKSKRRLRQGINSHLQRHGLCQSNKHLRLVKACSQARNARSLLKCVATIQASVINTHKVVSDRISTAPKTNSRSRKADPNLIKTITLKVEGIGSPKSQKQALRQDQMVRMDNYSPPPNVQTVVLQPSVAAFKSREGAVTLRCNHSNRFVSA